MQTAPFPFYQVKRVFLACPGDLVSERSKFPRLIATVNNLRAHSLGFYLEAVGWERVIPSAGRPQDLINNELRLADLVVVMFWNRIGSPSSNRSTQTGTVEEYKLARNLYTQINKPLVWLYFKKPTVDVGEQFESVRDFRQNTEAEKDLFFREYVDTDEWEEMFQQHLVAYLDGLIRWDIDHNVRSMRPEAALMRGNFIGEGIYKYGTVMRLSADFDGDGCNEEVKLEHRRGVFSLSIIKWDSGFTLDIPVWNKINNEEPRTVHLAIKDVTNDGLPEILLAMSDNISILRLAVYGFNSQESREHRILDTANFSLLQVLDKGQRIAHIFEGGSIMFPYGTAGLAWNCVWNGKEFNCTD